MPDTIDHACALAALREADFSSIELVKDVWIDVPYEAVTVNLHREELNHLLETIAQRGSRRHQVVLGQPGSGKTFLLRRLRKAAGEKGYGFVLVDVTPIRDFDELVLFEIVHSLDCSLREGRSQLDELLIFLLETAGVKLRTVNPIGELAAASKESLEKIIQDTLRGLPAQYRSRIHEYRRFIEHLFFMRSDNWDIAQDGYDGLRGLASEGEEPGFNRKVIIQALLWIMGLRAPVFIAFDQLDPIVSQHNIINDGANLGELSPELLRSKKLLESIATGLTSLYEMDRIQVVITCLDGTWETIKKNSLPATHHRFDGPISLMAPPRG